MRGNELAREREADAAGLRTRLLPLRHRSDRIGHAGAVVRYDDLHSARVAVGVEQHAPAAALGRGGKADRIVEQPAHDPRQARRIAFDTAKIVGQIVDEFDLFGLGERGRVGERLAEQRADVDRRAFDRQRPRLALRKIEHIVDLAAEHRDRIHDRVDIGARGRRKLARIAGLQHLAEAADRGERRAQFVTHPREESGLDLVRRLQRLVAFAQRALHLPAGGDVEHDEQRIAVGQRDRSEIEMASVLEPDFARALRPLERRGADHFLNDADLVGLGEPVGEAVHQHIDARMRSKGRFIDAPQAAETLVPQVQAAIGSEDRDRLEQIVEGRGAHAQQRVARRGQLHLLGAILGYQQQAAVGGRLGDDVQMGAVAQAPFLLARVRQREPVDMRLPPFGIVAHLGRPAALAPCIEQPRERPAFGHILGRHVEQPAKGLVRKDKAVIGAELRHRRRQPIEQFALGIDKAAVRAALALQLLNIDRIARYADDAAALGRQRHVDDAHDAAFALDRHRDGAHLRRARAARRFGRVGRADPGDWLAQFGAILDHPRRALRLDRPDIGGVDEREAKIWFAEPHRKRRRLDQARQRLERRHRLVAFDPRLGERLLPIGRIAEPQQDAARSADRLRRRHALTDDRTVAALRTQAEREGFGTALGAEDRLAQRFVRLRVEPGAESAKLVETARPGIEPEPAAEPLARLDAPVAAHHDGQIGRRFEQAGEPFGLPGDERRAPLHRNPAPDRPQPGDQPERGEQAEREEQARAHRHGHRADRSKRTTGTPDIIRLPLSTAQPLFNRPPHRRGGTGRRKASSGRISRAPRADCAPVRGQNFAVADARK